MSHPIPTELNLHRVSRVLEITFDDGSNFKLPAEYLRAFSPSAEVMGHGPGQRKVPTGIEKVNIDQIEPVGNYAIVLHFDDEHNTGIYSWETLYNLGQNYDRYWQQYLDELKEVGYNRQDPAS